jgi:hypothetical protein
LLRDLFYVFKNACELRSNQAAWLQDGLSTFSLALDELLVGMEL